MKKLIIPVLLAGILIFALAARWGGWKASSFFPDAAQGSKDISIAAEFPSYPADIESFNLIITNSADEDRPYVMNYYIEMQRYGGWYMVPDTYKVPFPLIAWIIPANTSQEYEISLKSFKSKPKPGKYRVIFNQAYAAEFELTEKGTELVSGPEELHDRRPMVMIDSRLYYDTGKESEITGRCGVMDGEITSAVAGTEIPGKDGQSNFGTGYGYQYTAEDTVEISIDGKWIVFERRSEDTSTAE